MKRAKQIIDKLLLTLAGITLLLWLFYRFIKLLHALFLTHRVRRVKKLLDFC